jgi:hypothetical protein
MRSQTYTVARPAGNGAALPARDHARTAGTGQAAATAQMAAP